MPIPDVIDFEMRGGNNPNSEMNTIERKIAEDAYNRVNNIVAWQELGYKRAYNFLHMLTFYMSRNPFIIKLMQQTQPYPEYIEMEMTQWVCSLRCLMCEISYDKKEKPIQLSFEEFKYAMDQFPNLKWAGNNALGDPFTNKDCWKIWKYLDDKGVVQELYLTSQLLKEEDMERFTEMKGLVWIKFSMDACTKETYEKIRVGANFDQIVKNIKAFDNYKRKHGKHFPEIHFHFIVMKDNIHEVLPFIDFVNGLGIKCSGITFSRLLHNFEEINDLFVEVPEALCKQAELKGKELGIPVSFNADIGCKAPASECMAWSMPYIFPDGTVINCCAQNEQNRRWWQRETSMGNIFQTPFREIWNGPKYKQLRTYLAQGKIKQAHPTCNICNIYDKTK